MPGRVVVTRTLRATHDNGADDASQEIAARTHVAAARQALQWFFDHDLTVMEPHATDPTLLWRVTRGRSTAHATLFPGAGGVTVAWFFDGVMDRAENYDTTDLALARADQIRGVLLRDGWRENE